MKETFYIIYEDQLSKIFLGTNKAKTLHLGAKDVFEKIVFR